MDVKPLDVAIAFMTIFSLVGIVGSLIALLYAKIKQKKLKLFALALAANIVVLIACCTYIAEHPLQKKTTTPQPSTQQTDQQMSTNDDLFAPDDKSSSSSEADNKQQENKTLPPAANTADSSPAPAQAQKNNSIAHNGPGPNGETIKGNINSKGEKIYHVPGGQFYDKTQPEAWFFTEEEARAAGYRASKR